MSLPEPVLAYLNQNARTVSAAPPQDGDDLFLTGVLDSFTLVDFVTVLEENAGIKVPDADVNPANFQTIKAIDSYVNERKG
jgi:acyl carrier protein